MTERSYPRNKKQETRNKKPETLNFILVYRLGIVAKPDRVMMQVAENICELVRKDSQTPASSWLVRDICNKPKGWIFVFVIIRVPHSKFLLTLNYAYARACLI